MSDEQKHIMAREAFDTFKKVLEENGIPYQAFDDDLVIKTGGVGDDLPMDMYIYIEENAGRAVIRIPMQFKCPKEKMGECSLLTCYASNRLALGQYNLDILNGEITYVNIIYYNAGIITPEYYFNMIIGSFAAADIYNDKYLMVIKGMADVGDIIATMEGTPHEEKEVDIEEAVLDKMTAEELALKKLIVMYKTTKSEKVLEAIYDMEKCYIIGKVNQDYLGVETINSNDGVLGFCSNVEAELYIKKNGITDEKALAVFIKSLTQETGIDFVLDDFVLPRKN